MVLISALKVGGVSRPVSALGEQDVALADLAPDRNQLQIDFLALGFGSGEVLRYQFRLDGADDDWTAPGDQRTITYASLAPGRYRFHVRAVNSDGVVSDVPARVSFRVLSPIWRRWWFLALAAVVVVSAVAGLYRYRVRRLVEMANMRTRIATDLHDDIGANLTRIALLSEVATRTGDVGPLASVAPHRSRVGRLDERHRLGDQPATRERARSDPENAPARRGGAHGPRASRCSSTPHRRSSICGWAWMCGATSC